MEGRFQYAGPVVVVLLLVFGIATVFGVPYAPAAFLGTVMLAAGVLGVIRIQTGDVLNMVAGLLLLGGCVGGIGVLIAGGNPFDSLPVLLALGVGIAITFFRSNPTVDGSRQS